MNRSLVVLLGLVLFCGPAVAELPLDLEFEITDIWIERFDKELSKLAKGHTHFIALLSGEAKLKWRVLEPETGRMRSRSHVLRSGQLLKDGQTYMAVKPYTILLPDPKYPKMPPVVSDSIELEIRIDKIGISEGLDPSLDEPTLNVLPIHISIADIRDRCLLPGQSRLSARNGNQIKWQQTSLHVVESNVDVTLGWSCKRASGVFREREL